MNVLLAYVGLQCNVFWFVMCHKLTHKTKRLRTTDNLTYKLRI